MEIPLGKWTRTVHVKETLSFSITATTERHPSTNDLTLLNDGITDDSFNNRVLLGDDNTPNPAFFIDLGANFVATDIVELTLTGNNFVVNRAQGLEIFVATELEGNFPETPYMDDIHGTLVASNIGVDDTSLRVTVPISGHEFRYIAIRQPNARFFELVEIGVQVTKDPAVPTITLIGDAEMTIELGSSFTDPGAMASDVEDGDLTSSIVVGGDTVDTNVHGTYLITYDVVDSDGIAARQITRTVHVKETLSFSVSATTERHPTINDVSDN